MALTRITKGVIKPNENYDTHNIVSTGIVTSVGLDVNGNADISGSLSVGGVLTYEDVTSIDSIGIITARSGLVSPYADIDDFVSVGSNIHLGNAGVITATSFVGSGAALTGIDATAIKDSGGNVKIQAQASGAIHSGVSTFQDIDVDGHTNLDNVSIAGVVTATSFVGALPITGDTNNRVITATGSGGLNGEANLTFSGSVLGLHQPSPDGTNYVFDVVGGGLFTKTGTFSSGDFNKGQLTLRNTTASQGAFLDFRAASSSGAMGVIAKIGGYNPYSGNGYDGVLTFSTRQQSTNTMVERLRITHDGRLLVNTSSSRTIANVLSKVQLEGTTADASSISITRNSNNAYPPYLSFGKSRGTSNGGSTIIQDADNLGVIRFSGADGNDLTNYAASINANVDGTPGNNVTPGRLVFSTTSSTGSDPTERLRIDSNGRLSFAGDTDTYIWHPEANELAVTLAGGSTPIVRFGTGGSNGTVGIKTDTTLVTNGEALSVRGYSSFKSLNDVYAALYTHNEDQGNGNICAHILLNVSGANRGGFGYGTDNSTLIMGNHNAISFRTGSTNLNGTERLLIKNTGGVGINTSLIRNNRFLNIAAPSQDYSNSSTELMDGGGICLQHTDSLASTNRTYPGIFWTGNTAALGRARAGILGVTASNNDATDIVFLTRTAANGTGFYPSDERMRIKADGNIIIGSAGSWSYPKALNVQGVSGSILSLYNADTTSYAADTNSAIELKLLTGNTGNQTGALEIRGIKENGTNGNNARALTFYTGTNGGGNSERFRITSSGQLLQNETSAFDSNVGAQFRYDNAGSQARFIFRNRGNNGSSRVRLIMSTLNRAANADQFSGMEKYQSGGMAIFNGETDNDHSGMGFFTGNWEPLRLRNGNVSGTDAVHIKAYWGTSHGLQMEVGGPQSGTHKAIRFQTSHYGGERGYIGVTLGGTSYNSSSDYRMKQDVVDMTGAIDRVKLFLPKRFKWKEDPTYTVDGFLAHEAATVVPESVNGEKDAVDSNGDPVYQVIDQSKLVPVLTAALKEAIAKIEILEAKVAALESS